MPFRPPKKKKRKQANSADAMTRRLRHRREQLGPFDPMAAREARLTFWAEQDALAEQDVVEERIAAD